MGLPCVGIPFMVWSFNIICLLVFLSMCYIPDFNGTDATGFWKIPWDVPSCFVFFHNWIDTAV